MGENCRTKEKLRKIEEFSEFKKINETFETSFYVVGKIDSVFKKFLFSYLYSGLVCGKLQKCLLRKFSETNGLKY